MNESDDNVPGDVGTRVRSKGLTVGWKNKPILKDLVGHSYLSLFKDPSVKPREDSLQNAIFWDA